MRLAAVAAFRPGGLVVAIIGFGITRVFVSEAVHLGASLTYLVSGILPLLVGLGLTVYGVALAVGPFSETYTRTVARWCVAGTLGMFVVIGVTAFDALVGDGILAVSQSNQLVANVLLGGAVGGVLIGTRSAANRQHRREIQRQVNRTRLFNRLLRHEVINALTIIEGRAELLAEGETPDAASIEPIRTAAGRIGETIDEVGRLSEDPVDDDPIDLGPDIHDAVERTRNAYPDVSIEVDAPATIPTVAADHRLRRAIEELLENAAQSAAGRVRVVVEVQPHDVSIAVSDDGSGLPESQRQLLETGRFPRYDDPGAGFGLQVVRLLVTRFGGELSVGTGLGETGTTVRVIVPRHAGTGELGRAVSLSFPSLNRAIIAGLLAGVAMGLFFSNTTDLLPVIGALYAVENPAVGWVTHLFHSVVFSILFAAGISHARLAPIIRSPLRQVAAAIGWGLVLWLVAAGLIMPLWLRFIGLPASLPNLPNLGLASHAIWGVVLGLSYALLGRFD